MNFGFNLNFPYLNYLNGNALPPQLLNECE